MKHLFLTYSSLHLLFAQAIASSECFVGEKVLWLGGPGPEFMERMRPTFRKLLMQDLWSEVSEKDYQWRFSSRAPREMLRRPVGRLHEWLSVFGDLRRAGVEREFTDLWLPHQYDEVGLLLAERVKEAGGRVHYFEEGLSIYMHRPEHETPEGLKGALGSLARQVKSLVGASAIFSPLEEFLDEAWLTVPDAPTLFSASIRTCDLSRHFDRRYLEALISRSEIGRDIEHAKACYPTTPFQLYLASIEVEDGLLGEAEFFAGVTRCLFFNSDAVPVIIKPHPRSNRDLLDRFVGILTSEGLRCELVQEDRPVPVEILAPLLPCTTVLGGVSSPLVYLKRLYGMETRSVLSCVDSHALTPASRRYLERSTSFLALLEVDSSHSE